MIPSLGLIFLVLGTIFMGLATPTEAGAMGVVGAIALAAFNGTLTWPLLYQGMATTMRITAMVVYILIGARVFSLVFQGVGGKVWIEHLLTSLPGGQVGFLVFVNVFIFVLAFFLDFFEIAFIIIPLLAPVADKLGIDLVWFGVLICANMQTSFMHPPFGFALFYLRGIAPPSIKTSDIYWGAIPWVVLQVILVVDPDLLAGIGDLLARARPRHRSLQDQDRHPDARLCRRSIFLRRRSSRHREHRDPCSPHDLTGVAARCRWYVKSRARAGRLGVARVPTPSHDQPLTAIKRLGLDQLRGEPQDWALVTKPGFPYLGTRRWAITAFCRVPSQRRHREVAPACGC